MFLYLTGHIFIFISIQRTEVQTVEIYLGLEAEVWNFCTTSFTEPNCKNNDRFQIENVATNSPLAEPVLLFWMLKQME